MRTRQEPLRKTTATALPAPTSMPAAAWGLTLTLMLLIAALLSPGVSAQAELPAATERIPGSDTAIEARLITAYTLNEHLNFHDIEVESDKGRVTLHGSVPTATQRWLAEHLAHELISARSIDNQLEVRPQGPTMADDHELYRLVQDANITTRVELQLQWSSATGDEVSAFSRDGTVSLSGSAASAAEKQAAERIALRTTAVRAVTNDIQVTAPEDAGGGDTDAGTDNSAAVELPDDEITARAAATLRFAHTVQDGNIAVSTEDGVVSLTGSVRNGSQKDAAAGLVRALSGVTDVDNQLRVEEAA